MRTVLAVNPGYGGVEAALAAEGRVTDALLSSWCCPPDTWDFAIVSREIDTSPSVVVIPGGIYGPSAPGTYRLTSKMAEEAAENDPFHPRNRLTVQAYRYCREQGIPGVVVEPMNTGTLAPPAEVSGLTTHTRRGVYYAFPQRIAFMESCRGLGLASQARGVTAYLGEEASVSSHVGDKVIDTSDPVLGEGPFGLTAAGTLPVGGFLTYLDEHPEFDPVSSLKRNAGAFGRANVASFDEFIAAVSRRDEAALSAVSAMGYHVSKEIGRQVACLSGKVDAIVLCGKGASVCPLRDRIAGLVGKWAPVVTYGEGELDLLFSRGTSVLRGEVLKEY